MYTKKEVNRRNFKEIALIPEKTSKEGVKLNIFSRKQFADLVGCSKQALADMQTKGLLIANQRPSGDYFYTDEHFLIYSQGKLTYEDFKDGVYTLGEFAKAVNCSPRTLQRLDKKNLLVAYRNPSNSRFYTKKQLDDYLSGSLGKDSHT